MIRAITSIAALILAATLPGCASTGGSFNDAMTPSVRVAYDKFDDSTIIVQPPVSAASSLKDDWHTLGFEWLSRNPTEVFLTAGINGTTAVSELAFNVDGVFITDIRQASLHTEFENGWSSRRFVMSLEDFLKVSRGQVVHMRLGQLNSYTVSSFGSAHPKAIVNAKIKPFTDKILELNKM